MWLLLPLASAKPPDLVVDGLLGSDVHVGPLRPGGRDTALWRDDGGTWRAWDPDRGEVVELEGATGVLHGWEDTDGDGLVELLFGFEVVQRWPDGTPLPGHGARPDPDGAGLGDWLPATPLGDVDGDGLLDHAVGQGIRWGHGSFTGLGGRGFPVPDLDGDGLPEVLIATPSVYYGPQTELRLFLWSDHTPTRWRPRWRSPGPGDGIDGVFLADADGVPPLELVINGTTDYHFYDGLLIVVGAPGSSSPTFTQSFGPSLPGPYQTGATSSSAGDLDGDGDDEVLFHHPPQLPVVWSLDRAAPRERVDGVVLEGWRPPGSNRYNDSLAAAVDLDGDGTRDLLAPFGWRTRDRVCGMLGVWWGDTWDAPGLALDAGDATCVEIGYPDDEPPDAAPTEAPRDRNQCGDGMIFSFALPLALGFPRRRQR
jgi:hypothetical protein